ncbi:MAG: uroporphyrinogen decarboxylase [Candidatus Dadabacteria bacterium]|nr:MAG: uroporphyrinogen decarboxylase [Candidatus Dadabacteria bacterium]
MSTPRPDFLAALAGRNDGPPPLWMMRQAGRTLASYRKLREGTDFLTFCKTPELAAEATLLPVRELGVDAAILFADILLPAEALGLELHFEEGVGPVTSPPVRSAADAAQLQRRDVAETCDYLAGVIRRVRAGLPEGVPLIGFAPSPWTLAAYLVEGRARKGFPALKTFTYADPAGFAAFLDLLTDTLCAYGQLQVEAGVQAFQIFDTWAELLPPPLFYELVLPRVQRLADAIDVPVIYFAKGTAAFFEQLCPLRVAALGCDWTIDIAEARQRCSGKALQGNLDPTVLYAPAEAIQRETWAMLDKMQGDRAYVVNLGHGLAPDIPESHVHAFVEAVRSWTPDHE